MHIILFFVFLTHKQLFSQKCIDICNKTGLYDFVFTYGGKTFAVMLTKFYAAKDIENKSDA
ncbi:MAG: hypothetical protein J6T96_10870 [Bacteroidales bacterium]|nr:hypothetical protein [Bacteroidales bacterium]